MSPEARLKRLHYRAHHRGTKEADLLIGGFFDAYAERWNAEELAWFEALMDEDDADIMAWALGQAVVPDAWQSPQMMLMRRVDYVKLPK